MCRERFRHVASKSAQRGRHPKLSHAREDLDGQVATGGHPAVRERPSKALHVAHAEPRQEGCARVEGLLLGKADVEALEDARPDPLLAEEGERQVDALHGHPVDVLLPVAPRHKREAVAIGANIHIVGPRDTSGNHWALLRQWQRPRRGQLLVAVGAPVDGDVQIVVEIPVEGRCQFDRAGSTQDD